jgi:TonB family protein
VPVAVPEPSRSELDVDLLSLLGPVSAAPVEASPTEMMPSSQAPTRPVENDELAALIAAEMAAPPTVEAPALAEQLSAAPTRAVGPSGGVLRPAAPKKVDDAFGFGDLHDLPTALPASESGVHVVHDAPPPRRGLPMGLIIAAGVLLVVGGVGLGIWLAPQGGGPAVAAPVTAPPTLAAVATVPPTAPPTAAPTEAAPAIVSAAPTDAAPVSAAPVSAEAVAGGAEAAARIEANGTARPAAVAARGPRSAAAPTTAAPAATPSRPSAFAGLDAARGEQTPKLTPKAAPAGGDLPAGLDQVEISAVIKRNIKAVQGCYQRQLKRDDTVAEGRATIRFRIQSDGRAKDVSMDRRFDGSVLEQCIVNVVERWSFPPFEGDPIPVEFPVIFTATF